MAKKTKKAKTSRARTATTQKKQAKKKTTGRTVRATRSTSEASPTTEIVFSYAEVDFLRKITKKPFEGSSPREKTARLSLRDKLLDLDFGRQGAGGGLIVLRLDRPEVALLQRITKELYSFITPEERRARLILREKILIAVEKLTGRKVPLETAP